MSNGTMYCIDTSSILQAWARTYPRDIFSALWDNIEAIITDGRLRSPDEVQREIGKKEDDLCKWAKAQSGLFVPLDFSQAAEVRAILTNFPLLVDSSKGRSGGDPFVIALAKLNGCTVITEEVASSSAKRPKIPDVCSHYNVEHITFLEFIRREHWTF